MNMNRCFHSNRKVQELFFRIGTLFGLSLFGCLSPLVHAQLSGSGDRFLVVGENLQKGAPDGSFGRAGIVTGDLDCDGRDDLVVMQPGATVNVSGTPIAGGVVTVIPSQISFGPRSEFSFEWHQGIAGVPGAVETGDNFGASAIIFDLNDDDCEDLFVGVPFEDIGTLTNAGAVQGFLGDSVAVLRTDRDGSVDGVAIGEETGSSLAGRGGGFFDRLYIGSEGRNLAGPVVARVGALTGHTFVSTGTNFLAPDDLLIDLRDLIGPSIAANHRWGSEMQGNKNGSLIAFRGDGANEVSLISGGLGSLGQDNQRVPAAGELMAIGNFDGSGPQHVQQNTSFGAELKVRKMVLENFVLVQTIPSSLLPGVEFTSIQSMATGDFNRDGFDDLALGFPGIDSLSDTSGNVLILRGSITGLITSSPQRLQQGVGGLLDTSESGDFFGSSLAVGDFNGDGTDDLAVGVPGELVLGEVRGGVHLILGTAQPLIFSNSFE